MKKIILGLLSIGALYATAQSNPWWESTITRIETQPSTNVATLVVTIEARVTPGYQYQVQKSSDLTHWHFVGPTCPTNNTDGNFLFTFEVPLRDKSFFRIANPNDRIIWF